MCGIAGFVGETEGESPEQNLRAMVQAIAHRGPDAEGVWFSPGVALGHRRLSILDLEGGRQPMETADGNLVVVFNGEIYNHRELRRELEAKGHRFVTDHSDTEVLLHGYRQWGEALPLRLNGMFAFALWDRLQERLFCARDRFGEKPFFYAERNGRFLFGSELSAIAAHPSVASGKTVSPVSFQKYMAYGYVPSPRTIYEGIFKLPAAHHLTWEAGRCRIQRYWELELDPFPSVPPNPEAEWGERIRELLERSVRARLEADVPVGVFLSGGIDSSAVTAAACRAGARVKTFTTGFEEPTFDESGPALEIARLFGTEHHATQLSIDTAPGLLDGLISQLDEPLGDASFLPTALLCEFAQKSVKVALGGDGADELFAGYAPFQALRRAELYQRYLPRPLHLAARLMASRLPVSHRYMSLDFKLKRTLRGLSFQPSYWLPVWMGGFDPAEAASLFTDPLPIDELFSEAIEIWDRCPAGTSVGDRTIQFFSQLYLENDILVKSDRASMRCGIEVRAPFLDNDLVDFVRRIPFEWKLRNGETKYILKKALEPILPQKTLYRAKKGFGVPVGAWFREGNLDASRLKAPSPFLKPAAARLLSGHRAGRSDERLFLWNQWVYQTWAAAHLNSSLPHAPH